MKMTTFFVSHKIPSYMLKLFDEAKLKRNTLNKKFTKIIVTEEVFFLARSIHN